MVSFSELYPVSNGYRTAQKLDGLWKFQFDPKSEGTEAGWASLGLPSPIGMPVPGSFADIFTTAEERDYTGDFWYETQFYLPGDWAGKKQYIRFGSVTHRCVVYCNGVKVAQHEGGFLPVVADVTTVAHAGQPNRLVVWVNNELTDTNIPCGTSYTLKSGRKITKPYFDFFNYSGIQRSVWLVQTASEAIQDYTVTYELDGEDALVHYQVVTNGDSPVDVTLADREGTIVASCSGKAGTLRVAKAHLWKVLNSYLYTICISIPSVDEYSEKIGIRTVEIRGDRFFISGEQVYLKGFGKHEDFDILGRGFSYNVACRDYECMKWIGANCFRTSHYPYAEEWYQMADEQGFLIIDEVAAVGLMRSFTNYAAAGSGASYTGFFVGDHVPQLQQRHMEALEEMITRDKNHPSVFSWSIFNEPETTSVQAGEYFAPIFQLAKELDPQHRPVTGVLEKTSSPDSCKCYCHMDFVCLNRYYGWYIQGGSELEEAIDRFRAEMDAWAKAYPGHPFLMTEYGADTLSTLHQLPGVMWSQEYQEEYQRRNNEVFDSYDFIQGELAWNFADFQTGQGIMRVGGNKKGVFTRQRQPKQVAYLFKGRWEKLKVK